ncbi:hypothetical protein OYC64_017937 [Pagothenia borchgrevinki]|uniref:Uncharacterized protein n=1 Tax=Pagothenia borchgrevinki TaxID=8213 RepID=A0ABD2GN64_PAGBO
MAGDDGRGNSLIPTAAVILILCALTQTLTCFSLHQLSKIVSKDEVSGAMVTEVRTGRILLNGKEFNSKSGSTSAPTTGNDGLLHIDSKQSDGRGLLETSYSWGTTWLMKWHGGA